MPENSTPVSEATSEQKSFKPKKFLSPAILSTLIILIILIVGLSVWALSDKMNAIDKVDSSSSLQSQISTVNSTASVNMNESSKGLDATFVSQNTFTLPVVPLGGSKTQGSVSVMPIDENRTKITITASSNVASAKLFKGNLKESTLEAFPVASLVQGKSETELPISIENVKTQMPLNLQLFKSSTDKSALAFTPISESTLVFAKAIGTFTAENASLITKSLVFPKSKLTISPDGKFDLISEGLSLQALGNEQLKINNLYPTVKATVQGQSVPNQDGEKIDMIVTALKLEFLADSRPLDAANSQKLLTAVQKAGITIPKVSTTAPIKVPVTITPNPTSGGFTIQNTTDAPFVVVFEGVKE